MMVNGAYSFVKDSTGVLRQGVSKGSEMILSSAGSKALSTSVLETAAQKTSKLGKYGKIAAIALAGLAAVGLVAKGASDKKGTSQGENAVYA